jgi:hypothetical protein
MVTMIADETPPQSLDEPQKHPSAAANDNNGALTAAIDPHILTVARALGRQIAREELKSRRAANDNNPEDTT